MLQRLLHLATALLISSSSAICQGTYGPVGAEVTAVPLWDAPLPSPQYAGYVNIPDTDKYIYYQLFVSQQSPLDDRLIVSIPGGPGGSATWSLIGPFLYANSFNNQANPLLIPDNVTVTGNPYSWTQEANLLLMESVAGVGYSYSLNDSDYTTSDSQAQIDMEATLRTWFQMYPYFANHTVFLQGASYSGVYVPLLGEAIINGNEDGASPYINLEGYLIGNGATDSSTDNINIFTLYSHWPLLPQSLADSLTASNCGTLSNPIDADTVEFTGSNMTEVNTCTDLLNDVNNLISYNVNSLKWTGDCFYGLEAFIEALTDQLQSSAYAWGFLQSSAVCSPEGVACSCYTTSVNGSKVAVMQISQQLAAEGIDFKQSLAGSGAGAAGSSGNAGCNYDERAAHVYFNRADVREAFHVQPVQDEAGLWLDVNSQVSTVYNYDITSVIPSHQFLISQGVRALMYSGDLDWQVPWTGTQYWTSQMGASLGLLADWQPWFRPDPLNYGSQLSGYITQYQGLSFMTFKAAGHRVLQDTPADAYIMFTNFIDDTLNATTTYTNFNNGEQSSIGIQ